MTVSLSPGVLIGWVDLSFFKGPRSAIIEVLNERSAGK